MNEKLYFALRDEIDDNKKQENTMLTFSYTLVATLLGLAYNNLNPWVAFLALLIIIPISYRVARYRDSIAYISAYMCIFLEPTMDIKWESHHIEYRNKTKVSKSIFFSISRMDFLFLGAICFFSFWGINDLKVNDSYWWSVAVLFVQIVAFIFLVHSTFNFKNVDKLKAKKIENWKKLKEEQSLGE